MKNKLRTLFVTAIILAVTAFVTATALACSTPDC